MTHPETGLRRIERPPMTRFLATFGFAWLMVGLFTGTLVLVVAVRWILDLLHDWGLGQTAQDRTLMGVIVLFVIGSFILTRALVRHVFRMHSLRRRRAVVASLALPGALSLWAWSNPTRLLAGIAGGAGSTVRLAGGPEFIFGAYPDDAKLRELKKEGVTTIVSLQHPAVLVEVQGIKAEEDDARRLGLKFVQAPMLPWVSDNSDAIAKIKDLALHGHGIYYVHCGLGRDRVNIAKRVIESVDSTRVGKADVMNALGFESRENGPAFQRGKIFKIAADEWLIPFPNRAELQGFILQGRAGEVFLLLDPADTLQKSWLAETEPLLRQYVVPYTEIPFAPADTARIDDIMSAIRTAKPPITIVVPSTSWGNPETGVTSSTAAAVMRATGIIPTDAHPRLVAPDSTVHERTLEMQEAAAAQHRGAARPHVRSRSRRSRASRQRVGKT
ncbi:MAG TPA: hypothetical protein VHB25_20225 [Gemmatimonadaceae bacterium]|nr:hypothetical protein [Gemmatimonadaceae bacterium]